VQAPWRTLGSAPPKVVQLGAVLAARLGLERVHAADDHTADGIEAGLGEDFEKAIHSVWSAPHTKIRQALDAQQAALESAADVLEFYRVLNRPETLRDTIQFDFGAALRHDTPQRHGRRYVAWWETRNLRMVANVRAAFGDQPGGRVLAIVGASHKPYFDAYLDMMHEVKLVDVSSVLR
jgi:hypothetical protein